MYRLLIPVLLLLALSAPLPGRTVAMHWMLVALGLTSTLTAAIKNSRAESVAYALAVREGSELLEPLDMTIIQITLTEMWQDIERSYESKSPNSAYR